MVDIILRICNKGQGIYIKKIKENKKEEKKGPSKKIDQKLVFYVILCGTKGSNYQGVTAIFEEIT